MSGGHAAVAPDLTAPSLRRRLAAFLYEGVLLFGVLMISGYLYSSLSQQRHALSGATGCRPSSSWSSRSISSGSGRTADRRSR